MLASELLADEAGLQAGWKVLDVACGNGNATLAAARAGTHAIGIDYVPELLQGGRGRAVAEGLDVEFRLGDAEDLPVADGSFDAVLSVFGVMFAPDHRQAANEIIRAARPGGTVGLASWTPDGFIGQMFGVITRHVPAPPGVASPLLWGTEQHLSGLFGAAAGARSVRRTCTWRFISPEEFVSFFRRWYGPARRAFEALDENGRAALAADLAQLARHWDRNHGGSMAPGILADHSTRHRHPRRCVHRARRDPDRGHGHRHRPRRAACPHRAVSCAPAVGHALTPT